MNKTGIEYLTHTWNPMHGCSPISPGCKNCWAEGMAKRLAAMGATGYVNLPDPFKVTLHPERLAEPLAVKKPARIGVSFMGDLFHDEVPFAFILSVFQTMATASHHTFLVLTKRPERMKDFFEWWSFEERLSNVWLGVTVENQEQADKRIPVLLQIPAAKRFVSVEPMLGMVDLNQYFDPSGWACCGGEPEYCYCLDDWPRDDIGQCVTLDWVVCGGESGTEARPCHPVWVRDLRDQCKESGIPFMFKQWGEYRPDAKFLKPYVIVDVKGNVFEPGHFPASHHGPLVSMMKVGKKKAGNRVDEYDRYMEMPVW